MSDEGKWSTSSVRKNGSVVYSRILAVYSASRGCAGGSSAREPIEVASRRPVRTQRAYRCTVIRLVPVRLMMHGSLEHSAGGFGERVDCDECGGIDFIHDVEDLADFEPGDDAEENFELEAASAAAALEDGDAALEAAVDRVANQVALLGDDVDRGVFLDAVQQEVERL